MINIEKHFPGEIKELGVKQALFSACLANLIETMYNNFSQGITTPLKTTGIQIRFGDGCILPNRKVFHQGGILKGVIDCVHMIDGCHYMLLAQDLNIFIDGVWQDKGTEPIWLDVKKIWTEQHPLCRSGLDFGDPNHVSITHNNKR